MSDKQNSLKIRGSNTLLHDSSLNHPEIQHAEPLWKRAPTRDPEGKPYSDFMMIVPGLRNFESSRLRNIINKMEAVLKLFEKDIIVADLNLKINVLWVTIQPRLGLSTEMAALLHHAVPEAKLVSQHSA